MSYLAFVFIVILFLIFYYLFIYPFSVINYINKKLDRDKKFRENFIRFIIVELERKLKE